MQVEKTESLVEGRKVGKLLLDYKFNIKGEGNFWMCKCNCGNLTKKPVRILNEGIKLNKNLSCGCARKESILKASKAAWQITTKWKGKYKKQLKRILGSMKKRCYNKKDSHYSSYGGRGIKICNDWLKNSSTFYDWCINNGYKLGLSIERIDNDRGYHPFNCKFIPMCEQQKNTQKTLYLIYKRKKYRVSELIKITGISYSSFQHRINRKWNFKDMFKPMRKRAT